MGGSRADRKQGVACGRTHDTPVNKVTGAANGARVGDVVADLATAGFAPIAILAGEAGLQRLRETSAEPGMGGFFNRLGLGLAGHLDHLRAVQAEVKAGRAFHLIDADDESKRRAGEVLARHGAHLVTYFGRWSIEPMG
jgi:hypothetical protein